MNLTTNSSNIVALPFSQTLYEVVGGEATFARIADRFYNAVAADAFLSPMYPGDWDESKRTLKLFLMQFFGGPDEYSQERGHPRLRMRHAPFSIGEAERDAWMQHMTAAIEAESFEPQIETVFLDYFARTATFLMNK